MTHWDDIRESARVRRASALAEAAGDHRASSLLAALDRLNTMERIAVPHGDSLLDGAKAVLDRDAQRIWFDRDVDAGLALFYQAHEYAHLWLHHEQATCRDSDLDPEADEDDLPMGVQRVEGYGPNERREREANVFAREFLLPLDVAHEWYVRDDLRVPAIAQRTGLPEDLVLHQVARAVLTPRSGPDSDRAAGSGADELPLDASQTAAACSPRGPLLVDAGPGTGKTRTLCARVLFLLKQHVPPTAILALTFSNRAAEEMRARVARARPDVAPLIWMGTFHAYGLELLRKYGERLGLSATPEVLDPADAVALLESRLADLPLAYYRDLREPALPLRHIVGAISRAKDELVGPAEYAQLAERMRAEATCADEEEAAAKALEVAAVYAAYEKALDADGLLDFGDLIHKAVRLLREHTEVRDEVRRKHPHVLVDEYQDVNRASAMLLREMVGAGAGLWVVGDARQSIYRFRGAAPENLHRFTTDFPGAKVTPLRRNYRSGRAVVRVTSAFAKGMPPGAGGGGFADWVVERQIDGRVTIEVAADLTAEAEGLARLIEELRAAGVRLREQAVLCRSHTTLSRIAAALEQAGIPTFYLGDLFERPEVRDMLALVSLTAGGGGRGLLRVARFSEYSVPLRDVLTLFRLAREQQQFFPEALGLAATSAGISEQGKAGLAGLASHIAGVHYGTRPWTFLASHLFVRSDYLRPLLGDESVRGQQQRLALYQLLRFAAEYRVRALGRVRVNPRRQFLEYVRWLEELGEEKQLRLMPSWADGMDSVRLLTVHASKGLEFKAVYMPALGQGIFPARRQGRPCPPPKGMCDSSADQHESEEACLFFVGLSRATDFLCLSRAERYSAAQRSNASDLLDAIRGQLPRAPDGPVTWPGRPPTGPVSLPDPPEHTRPFMVDELDTYSRCPRQYYYRYVLEVRAGRDGSGYVEFHRCVYDVLRWIVQQRRAGEHVDEGIAQRKLEDVWQTVGPQEHAHAPLYRRVAESMVQRAIGRVREGVGVPAPQWDVALPHGQVTLVPDDLEALSDGSEIVERLRTGRPTKTELAKDIYALYVHAAAVAEPQVRRTVRARFLSTDTVQDVTLKPSTVKARLRHYDDALVGVARGDFAPTPSEHNCPRCAFYFVCPTGEDQ